MYSVDDEKYLINPILCDEMVFCAYSYCSNQRHNACKAINPNSKCVRWTTCKKLGGKFAGACGKSVFDVCCSVSSNHVLKVKIYIDLKHFVFLFKSPNFRYTIFHSFFF